MRGLLRTARRAGLVDAALNGHDVPGAIALETSERLLLRLLRAATDHREEHWIRACVDRLHELNPSPAITLQRAELHMRNGRLPEAEALADMVDPEAVPSGKYRMLRAALDAKNGRVDDAAGTFLSLARSADLATPARTMLDTINEMLSQSDLDMTAAFITEMRESFPDSLELRSLDLLCALQRGLFAAAEELAVASVADMPNAPVLDQRALQEASATFLSHVGWYYQLIDFVRQALERDPTHWQLYLMASEAAKTTSQGREYEDIVDALPEAYRGTPGAQAVLCKLHSDEHRPDSAAACLAGLRESSAQLFLVARRYIAATRGKESEVDEACRECERCGLPALPSVLIHSMHSFHLHPSAERAAECIDRLSPLKSDARASINFWLLYLKCLIAADRDGDAAREYADMPEGMRYAARLRPFGMYFEAMHGEGTGQAPDWAGYLRSVRHPCINARSSYPETLSLKYAASPGAVLLVSTVYNGAEYLDWFLDHYRQLGVDHFFITDNGSTDGTRERLLAEEDVSVFLNDGSFGQSAFGVLWVNHLLQRFGVGHWSFHVDIDEGFVYPRHQSGRTLRDLLAYADANGFQAFGGTAVDMYPDVLSLDGRAVDFASCTNFDDDYCIVRSELPPYFVAQGGIRQRLTGLGMAFHKVPLARVDRDFRYIDASHNTTHVRFADIRSAVLHYKFIGDAMARTEEAIARREHFAAASTYVRFAEACERIGTSGSLVSSHTSTYTGTDSLEAAGILASSSAWDSFDSSKLR